MKTLAAALLLLSCGTCGAQERQFTITLPESQLNWIGKVLDGQPYRDAAPVVGSIQEQINAQLRRQAEAERERIKAAVGAEIEKEGRKPAEDNK